MKKTKMLTHTELASFCGELALLLPAGITPYDAILCMQEDSSSPQAKKLLEQISKKLAKGKSLSQIADECEETEERIQELMKKL